MEEVKKLVKQFLVARKSKLQCLTDILLLELSGKMSLDEGGLADTTVTDQDKLELGNRIGLQ